MVIKNYIKGIAFVILILSAVLMVMAAAPSITYDTQTPNNNTISVNYINVSVTLGSSGGLAILNWNGTEEPMSGSGTGFYKNKSVTNGSTNTFFVRANDTTPTNWSVSDTRIVNVNIPTSPPEKDKPLITSFSNNKTNDASTSISVNVSEIVSFNATANQTITTWNWFRNDSSLGNNFSYLNYTFDTGGTHIIKVNATNGNGTSSNNAIWTVQVRDTTPPANVTITGNTSGPTWIKWTWTNPTTDFDHAEIYLNGSKVKDTTSNSYNTSENTTALSYKTTYIISLRAVDGAGNPGNWTNSSAITTAPSPTITRVSPSTPIETIGSDTKIFTIQMGDQTANATWYLDNASSPSQTNSSVSPGSLVNFTLSLSSIGSHNITVSANNENGTSDTTYWNWSIRSNTFYTGNRIWDGSRPNEFSLTYWWNPMSFSGFYYDIKDDVGTENITVTLDNYNDRNINKNDLVYSTTPQEVSFVYSGFGKFQVIGFMADKYFAGYTANTTPPNPKPETTFAGKSVISSGQLHKVLMDDDSKKTISLGSTLTLQEGYVLKATDIDMSARTMLLSLLKDGNEVDSTPLSAGETYIYTKKVGSVSDLPLIMVRFDSVFSGREVQAAFLKGIFQISETATNVKSGDKFGRMEVGTVSATRIEMSNSEDISLSTGRKEDLMGDIKLLVADNSSVVRFALSVEKTGPYEVRSSIFRQDDANNITVWTPYNFGMNIGQTSVGFYYDLDDGVGNESMRIDETVSGKKINDGKLVYMTTPQEVSFVYSGFGKFQVIGFMAEKYFAGYTANTVPPNPRPEITFAGKSVIASGQLHKVLIDDDSKKTISVGSTLTLQEGYVLKATDIDMSARTMLISLLKDGNEIDSTPLSAGETYVYAKKVGSVSDLPLIMARFDSVFSGKEVQAAFLKGLFQISETATNVKSGDKFGKMEVTGISGNSIEMANDGNLGLDRNKNEDLMGKIKLRVADSESLRFYFAVDVTQEMIANQLVIDAPAKVMAGDNITIMVKAGGSPVDNASISLDSDIGNTNKNGILNYTLPKTLQGKYNITATKLGYQKQVKPIEIEKYIDLRLSLDVPAKAPQFDPLTIKVTYNNSATSGASVNFDNQSIGTTDSNGILTYAPQVSGTHTITASKSGYITVTRDIELIVPYSEFKALDINITPSVATPGMDLLIKANITNSGTKGDTLPVDLIINGTAVKNTSLSLDRGATKEINFTGNLKRWMPEEVKPGNYTVEILGQTQLLEVKEEPLSWVLIGGIVVIVTAIAGGVIYVLTSKNMLNIEALKSKFSELLSDLGSKIRK